MPRPQHYFDWQQLVDERADAPAENTRLRLRWIMAVFMAAGALILARAVQLELADGDNFRRLATEPRLREVIVAAPRGRILARDGTVLAGNREARAVAVEYRYLENPPNPQWLRLQARARLSPAARRRRGSVSAMEATVRGELVTMHRRLAALCEHSPGQWEARTARIQRRVTELAARVNARRQQGYEYEADAEPQRADGVTAIIAGLFAPPERLPPAPVIIVEETVAHQIVDDVSVAVAAEIESHPARWPGVVIVNHVRRDYPHGSLAANLLGHVAKNSAVESAEATDSGGLMGIEHLFERRLAGTPGLESRQVDRRGDVLATNRQREPVSGSDVVLAIDPQLQRAAESWLDRRTRARRGTGGDLLDRARGGALVVMDVHTGELLCAAGSPRFDPNWFAAGDERVEAVLHDPRRPLFDRATRMAIAPGSVFKPLAAIAMIEGGIVDPRAVFRCQGYFDDPDRLRCQIYRQHGIGHGDITLADALAQSCNVFFFHHALELKSRPLLNWAARLGFGEPTGLEADDEAPGTLPEINESQTPGQTQLLAIGQGTLTTTPLQVVRMYAAIANGGFLVTPRLLLASPRAMGSMVVGEGGAQRELGEAAASPTSIDPHATPVPGLAPSTLAAVREGLQRVVDDANGTAFDSVRVPWPAVAGKTGTAQSASEQGDHAWFAGYAPADAPRYAFVVVLEHGGSGADAAGSIARRLVLSMRELGYFGAQPDTPQSYPPGKG